MVGAGLLIGTVTGCASGISHTSGTQTSPSASGVSRLAPYVDMTLPPAPDLAAATADGVGVFNLAFVTAASGACQPSWGGRTPYDDARIAARIRALRERGADARVSFGGAQAEELAQVCGSVPAVAAAYQKVIDTYDLTLVDFDVEGAGLADHGAMRRRNLAVSQLEETARRRGHSLGVSYTLPAGADGLTAPAQDLLRDAHAAGIDVAAVNVMTMNTGSGSVDMGEQSIAIARAAEAFVGSIWTGGAEGSAWSMIALTPMIGVNDSPGERFRLRDAARLLDFARQHRLAWLSFWSLNRDRPCPSGTPSATASPWCSGIEQTPGQFAALLAQYR
jgi:hypothetical protein